MPILTYRYERHHGFRIQSFLFKTKKAGTAADFLYTSWMKMGFRTPPRRTEAEAVVWPLFHPEASVK